MSIAALKSKSESRHRSYTRTEENRYVYVANPTGQGGTVGATQAGSFSFKASEGGKPPVEKSGTHAGMMGGEVDASGNIIKGSSQHVLCEGDKLQQEIRGESDPSIFVEKVGLKKPEALRSKPFDLNAPKLPMKKTLNDALDEFKCTCDFKGDPLTLKHPLSALKGQ